MAHLDVLHDDIRNKKSGDYEEHVDPNEPARRKCSEAIENYKGDRDRPQAAYVGPGNRLGLTHSSFLNCSFGGAGRRLSDSRSDRREHCGRTIVFSCVTKRFERAEAVFLHTQKEGPPAKTKQCPPPYATLNLMVSTIPFSKSRDTIFNRGCRPESDLAPQIIDIGAGLRGIR